MTIGILAARAGVSPDTVRYYDLSVFLGARDSASPPCRQVRQRAGELLQEVEARIRMLTTTKRHMRTTLRDWDSRLAATAPGTPARLLDSLPQARATTARRVTRRLGGRA